MTSVLHRGHSRLSGQNVCPLSRTSPPESSLTRPQRARSLEHHRTLANKKPSTDARSASEFNGAPDTIRTYDTRFRRAVLYPLSYGGASRHFSTFRPMRHYFFAFPRPPCIPDDHRTACRSMAPMHENRAQTHPERASASCGLSPATCAA